MIPFNGLFPWRIRIALKTEHIPEVLCAFLVVALVIFLSAYLFPVGGELARNGLITLVPILVSVLLLAPIYVWYREHRKRTKLSKNIKARTKGTVFLWVLALFILALCVRIPSVLLFGAPYEKTPLILLTILTIVIIEKTDLSAFGFTTKKVGESLLYGLTFFLLLNMLSLTLTYLLISVFTGQTALFWYDATPFVLAMPFMTLCVGISEEGLFRGYMQTRLERAYTTRKAILIQALLFGVWHFVWNLSPFDPSAMAQYVAVTFFIGLLFGYFYSKTRSLMPLVFAHGLWNSVAQGITENKAAFDALGTTPLTSQILTLTLPYIITIPLTILFLKYFVKNTTGA